MAGGALVLASVLVIAVGPTVQAPLEKARLA